jgi:hypothetical protein
MSGKLNQIKYESAMLFGKKEAPSTVFTFFKEIKQLNDEEIEQLGKTLVPNVRVVNI